MVQTEMFPKTTIEILEGLRTGSVTELEKARKALDDLDDDEKIARRYEKAEEHVKSVQVRVREIDVVIEREQQRSVVDAASDMKRHAEESGTRVTLTTGDQSVTFGAVADPALVVALYPGDDEPHVTEIGEHTRYAELVADYLTAAGIAGEVDADQYSVVGEDDGELRSLVAPIEVGDYGRRLLVVGAGDDDPGEEALANEEPVDSES
jgi:hypothetical protein